jgi:hypothetical protein
MLLWKGVEIMAAEQQDVPCEVERINEPNLELMAIAFRNLYYDSIRQEVQQELQKK